MTDQRPEAPILLHGGCGPARHGKVPEVFEGRREVRLDVDPTVAPDIVASMTEMPMVADSSVDALWSSHSLEHLEAHQVLVALRECRRALKPDGFAYFTLPDLQQVAKLVVEDRLDDTVYTSPIGPTTPLDILFGHGASLEGGRRFMAHQTRFTARTLGEALVAAGFAEADVWATRLNLWAVGYMTPEAVERHAPVFR